MGFISLFFKKKNDSNNKNVKQDHEKICALLDIYDKYREFINQNNYISRKEYIEFQNGIIEDVEYISKLDNDGLLKDMCLNTSYDVVRKYLNELNDIEKNVQKHNDKFIKDNKVKYKDYLDSILDKCDPNIMLDDEQRTCILSDEDYTLIIAGAGAGKTTTLAAKVKYLVDIKKVDPKEILVISFTNKAVGELKERINKQLGINSPITTFHSAGVAIIKKDSEDKKFRVVDEGYMYNSVNKYLKSAIASNEGLLDKMITLFASYFEAPFTEGDLKKFFTYLSDTNFSTLKSNLGEYNNTFIDSRSKKMITINDERVKSLQEVKIANFLYMNNIDYIYEPAYDFFIDGSDKIYTPDFLVTQGNKKVYIEHFALSQEGTNSRFSDDDIVKYKKSIRDKIKLHKEHKTNLICTWSKYKDGKDLLTHLEENLLSFGFELKRKDSLEIFQKLKSNEENKYLSSMANLIQNFISIFKIKGYDASQFNIMKSNTNNIRTRLFLEIAEGAYLNYEKNLKELNRIDFSDMINLSTKLLLEKKQLKEKLPFKYIIVDEYQDISKQRFDLTKTLSDLCDAKVIAVGDDWQSIYAFSGSDVSLFTEFSEKMGYAKELKIVKTYRNPQEVIDIAGGFIQENKSQIKKALISSKHITKPVVIMTYNDERQILREQGLKNETDSKALVIEETIEKILEFNKKEGKDANSSILLIGRYGFDGRKLGNTSYFDYNERTKEIKSKKYPDINLSFMTAHSSKGLGQDNVIIINAVDTLYGFPSQIEIDPVLKLVIKDDKSYDYAEERRLFYVAMTRTKNRVFIVTPESRPSKFILELISNYKDITLEGTLKPRNIFSNTKTCPICGYPLQLRYNKNYGLKLYMCTNEPEICDFITNDIRGGKVSLCKCDKCKDGYLIVKNAEKTNNLFLGCTNFKSIKCTRMMSFDEYFKTHRFVGNEK